MSESPETRKSKVISIVLLFAASGLAIWGVIWSLIIDPETLKNYSFYGPELPFAASIWLVVACAMVASRWWQDDYKMENEEWRRKQIGAHQDPKNTNRTPEDIKRHLIDRKMHSIRGLLSRDIGPLTFDVASHADLAEVSEYRGVIHWHRDVIEKLLSILLSVIFSVFLGRGIFYGFAFIKRSLNLTEAITHDINMVGTIIGLALILDGILLVAAMSDAPGIGRTIDSLIVVLTGVAISSSFPIKAPEGANPVMISHSSLVIIFAIALLFIVRWIIRHHTLAEWVGSCKNKNTSADNNEGAIADQDQASE